MADFKSMAEFESQLSKVWKKLRESKEISEQLINDLQEWAIEEEFDLDALIDDINDREDESSISQFLKNNKYNKENEFQIIQKLITPQSYYDAQKNNSNDSKQEDNIQVEYDDVNDEKNLQWNCIPHVTIKQIIKNENSPPPQDNNSSTNINIDQSNPNHIQQLLSQLNDELDFKSNPSVIEDIIDKLQEYNLTSDGKKITVSTTKGDNENINDSDISGVNAGDLSSIKSSLKRLNEYTTNELDEFVRFCTDEEYGEDQLIDDIEVFEEGDSAIIENMASIFDWNSGKAARFVNSLRSILGIKNAHKRQESSYITLNQSHSQTVTAGYTPQYNTPGGGSSEQKFTVAEVNALPALKSFVIPTAIMKKKIGRSIEDIEDCFRQNGISNKIINMYTTFCEEEKCDEEFMAFTQHEHGEKLQNEFPSIGFKLTQYILKCQYELKIPLFKPSTFTKKDETEFSQYMERECPGIIKHDRDLLRYFLLTKVTESDLSSLLIDIVDRISVNDEHPLDLKTFTNKSFFKALNNRQSSIIKNGLRTYHNRFFPRLTMNPLSLICDKVSDYQKYACILSEYVAQIVDRKIIDPPILIDFMIIPPGVYNKILNNFTVEKCIDLGDISEHLNDFENNTYTSIDGLNANGHDNFNEKIMNDIVAGLVDGTEKLIKSIGDAKKYQRIVILIDRRWRLLNKKHCLYNKLRSVHTNEVYEHKDINKDTYDYKEYENDNGLTHDTGFEECDVNIDDDDDDISTNASGGLFGNKSTQINFEDKLYETYINESKINNDRIYIYQPKTISKSRKLNEFGSNFCHETLMYLTKQCILPRKKATLQKYKAINGKNGNKKNNYNKFGHDSDSDDDEYSQLVHLSGDSADGYMFNLSVHIYPITHPHNKWYRYKLKWYLFTQSASIRIHQNDFNTFWFKYFVDPEKDIHKLNEQQLKKYFKFDLFEVDVGFKRWYHAIKRTINS